MKIEGTENIITPDNEAEYLKETSAMQAELFKRWHGFMDEDKFATEWIPKHSKDFRRIFEDEIRANPRLIEEWNNPASRESVLQRFEEALHIEPSYR
jgi:hypothetical protein